MRRAETGKDVPDGADSSKTRAQLNRRKILKIIGVFVVGAPPLLHAANAGAEPQNKRTQPKKLTATSAGSRVKQKKLTAKATQMPPTLLQRFPKSKAVIRGRIPAMTGKLEVANVSLVRGKALQDGLSATVLPPGRPAKIIARVRTHGSGRLNIPWQVAVDDRIIKSGTKKVTAGREFVLEVPWTPTTGDHKIAVLLDPQNKQKQPAGDRQGAERVVPVSADNWGVWSEQLLDATKFAVETWKLQAHFQNITIMAMSANGAPGCLTGPDLSTKIKTAPMAHDVPASIKNKFADVVAQKFKEWQDNVTVPGLPWYPAFAAFPGPYASPMPNVPTPLIACVSSGASAIIAAPEIESALLATLGNDASSDVAQNAVRSLSHSLALGFLLWLTSSQIMLVMGKGPVPAFAPPFVPIGPVIGGDIIPAPGHLAAAPSPVFQLLP